jgi:Endonuclease/Exonuclease/phosphatase family
MKIASYNVENLFLRAKAMNQKTWAEGADVLKMHAEMNRILGKKKYTAADKKKIVDLMKKLGIDKKDDGGGFVILRQNRGQLVKRPTSGGLQVVADGRDDWIGWLDLKTEAVNEIATRMTAKVIDTLGADVIALIEAENRPSLIRFQHDVIGSQLYDHIMLIDGNDDRGIDVAQAQRVKLIYEGLRQDGADNVAVVGDFNDTPDSDPLSPLLHGTDLKDISGHPNFDNGGRPGTFRNGTASNKIDYILLSPALFAKATRGQIFRMGVWGGTNGTLFPHFPEITKSVEAASDHAAITAEIDV